MTQEPEHAGRAGDGPPPEIAPEPAAGQQEEILICIGGAAHGEVQAVPPGATSWVHLLSASTYHVRRIPYVSRNPLNPHSKLLLRAYAMQVLVHESIYGDPQTAMAWFQDAALLRLYGDLGAVVPVDTVVPPQQPDSPNGRGAPQ